MTPARLHTLPSAQHPSLTLFHPDDAVSSTTRWRINGHPARIIIWTSEEFERMADPPADAFYNPCGVWCALRVD